MSTVCKARVAQTTNVFSEARIVNCTVSACDVAYRFYGGAVTNTGMISIIGGSIEACGRNSVYGTNTVECVNQTKLNLERLHFEANRSLSAIGMINCHN